ncbi:hypothetical protein PUNSTDRAFT_55813 [Punctularia strigosozonata HHB-11173 SS5]|uniref:Uncharacterized protein n=1 Tax=Punctularia strigosozonata (strain HHB-11173) TaxID=741275 RepID=R7S272_PUNST|nr:uncharacterized protein PUNSTDRAFT_55813 [Punctularia strigosozonata HHB-11173 SS5]EIN03964.1 hypothetical protein PUNSTDRAFT_55813 [Punctularia strigosozonata HHB-11173 SS5]
MWVLLFSASPVHLAFEIVLLRSVSSFLVAAGAASHSFMMNPYRSLRSFHSSALLLREHSPNVGRLYSPRRAEPN